jgi:methionine biosynthesis protein MetW
MILRDDLQLIYDWVPEGSRVLDLGCGDGELLSALVAYKQCSGYGVEIDTDSVIAAIGRGVNVIQADLEQGLLAFGDHSFDVIVLSQTIQAMQNTETILQDLTIEAPIDRPAATADHRRARASRSSSFSPS